MKRKLSILVLILSASAFGEFTPTCGPLICGTFTGPIGSVDSDGNLVTDGNSTESVTLADLGHNRVSLKFVENGDQAKQWNLIMSFHDNGQFDITRAKDGGLYGSGLCAVGVCSYALMPFDRGSDIVSSSGTLRFSKGHLHRYQFFTLGDQTRAQLSDLSPVK